MSWALRELGLPADADERAIKRAYAARLKTVRPETDPEGFQKLNEAYQAALEWLRQRPAPSETPSESSAASNAAPSGYASVKLHFEGVPISMPPFRSARRDENARADFDEQDFFFTVLEQSEQLDPRAFKQWLERNEALYSMPLKAALAEPLVWFLHDQPPLTREHLAITLAFFRPGHGQRHHDAAAGAAASAAPDRTAQRDRLGRCHVGPAAHRPVQRASGIYQPENGALAHHVRDARIGALLRRWIDMSAST